jgi:hypothetical protein
MRVFQFGKVIHAAQSPQEPSGVADGGGFRSIARIGSRDNGGEPRNRQKNANGDALIDGCSPETEGANKHRAIAKDHRISLLLGGKRKVNKGRIGPAIDHERVNRWTVPSSYQLAVRLSSPAADKACTG